MKSIYKPLLHSIYLVCGYILLFFSCQPKMEKISSLEESMDGIINRFFKDFTPSELKQADEVFVLSQLSEEEKQVLSTQFWHFNTNVPVNVSIMRHTGQQEIPFWLAPSGFEKTELIVTNEEYTYEVWRKEFPAGKVGLGIPGLANHRTPYFVSVGKADKSSPQELEFTDIFPNYQELQAMGKGTPVYTCWELEVQDYPEELEGDILMATNRGRPRESHLVNAIRETNFPSSSSADQIAISWSGDTKTTMDIQWRTSLEISSGELNFWKEGTSDTLTTTSSVIELYDRLVYNDPRVNHHSTQLKDLEPGTNYFYQINSGDQESEVFSFNTASEDDDFTFIWFGDTHHSEAWGNLLQHADQKHPQTAFYSIAGDIVTHGLYKNEWDDIYGYSGKVLSQKPLMPVPGNHDNQDDLGNQLYYDLWSYPKNAPKGTPEESSYSFVYKNALFLMIDATQEVDLLTPWIEEQLKNSDATWKFAMFHFPPYNWEEPYLDLQQEWVPLFDKYHVDMVMSGHVHYYMRSLPMNAGKVVDDFSKGTVYAISIGIPSNPNPITVPEPYAVVQENKSQYYQTVEIKGGKLKYVSYNVAGEIVDEFEIRK
jgi:predicted phosphodiesterase